MHLVGKTTLQNKMICPVTDSPLSGWHLPPFSHSHCSVQANPNLSFGQPEMTSNFWHFSCSTDPLCNGPRYGPACKSICHLQGRTLHCPHIGTFAYILVQKCPMNSAEYQKISALFQSKRLTSAQLGPLSPAGHSHWPLTWSQPPPLFAGHRHGWAQFWPKKPLAHAEYGNIMAISLLPKPRLHFLPLHPGKHWQCPLMWWQVAPFWH